MSRLRFKKTLNLHQNSLRDLIQDSMETRMRSRAHEELTTEEGKIRDRKGKAIVKEEPPEENYEIYDDSEEEEGWREAGKKNKKQGKNIGGWVNPQSDEEQPTPQEERVRRYDR